MRFVIRLMRQNYPLLSIALLSVLLQGCSDASSENAEDAPLPDSQPEFNAPPRETTLTAAETEEPNEERADPADVCPFPRRIDMPDFPEGMTWMNTRSPIALGDLEGKFVLLDFWTYCCINCIHVLPELKKLEEAYPNNLVVIGVHSAKFDAEEDSENIRQAILRYRIAHPVINDHEHEVWNNLGVRSWPTLLLIDPEGKGVYGRSGEFKSEEIAEILDLALPWYREHDLLDESPLWFDLLSLEQEPGPLAFPGKVLADEARGQIFIADSNHHRIVITDLEGNLLEIVGSGQPGSQDGAFAESTFQSPQGMILHGDLLYLADTENHLIRAIDLESKSVRTVAGTGEKQGSGWPGLESLSSLDPLPERWVGPPRETALGSPWALWIHDEDLYIAMAGPHQIWKMPLDESEIGPYAGNGREDIIDGPLLPARPYEQGFSSFAQPSGLASDGDTLFVADSEGSSIRSVPFDPEQHVSTVVGTANERSGRLFRFGDVDGTFDEAEMQHALGVSYHEGILYVADTYNNKIKAINLAEEWVQTLAGGEDSPIFDEPAGLSYAAGKLYVADTNHHAIRVIDLENNNQVSTLEIPGLAPPTPPAPVRPSFSDAANINLDEVVAKRVDGAIRLSLELELPEGWKLNPNAPMRYWLEIEGDSGLFDPASIGLHSLDSPTSSFEITLPAQGEGTATLQIAMCFHYCEEDEQGLCKVGSVVWTLPLNIQEEGIAPIPLEYSIQP